MRRRVGIPIACLPAVCAFAAAAWAAGAPSAPAVRSFPVGSGPISVDQITEFPVAGSSLPFPRVRSGEVRVTNRITHRSVIVHGGHSITEQRP